MGNVAATTVVPGPEKEARDLWFDTSRWPAFVDGFRAVKRVDPGWPESGAIVWESTPHGPGRTRETVQRPGVAEIENERLSGTQTVTFITDGDAVRVVVELKYKLKDRNPLMPIVDVLFVRRALRDSLTRTVERYAAERRADNELL